MATPDIGHGLDAVGHDSRHLTSDTYRTQFGQWAMDAVGHCVDTVRHDSRHLTWDLPDTVWTLSDGRSRTLFGHDSLDVVGHVREFGLVWKVSDSFQLQEWTKSGRLLDMSDNMDTIVRKVSDCSTSAIKEHSLAVHVLSWHGQQGC